MTSEVRVMRSYDYCHFEICLGVDDNATLDQVNERRKEAALLVDEAVRQYVVAKGKEEKRKRKEWETERYIDRVNHIKETPKSEWSVEDAAVVRAFEEGEFWKEFDSESYIYEEDFETANHFSMLRKFQDTRITAIPRAELEKPA